MFLLLAAALAQDSVALTVRLDGVDPGRGESVYCALFDTASGFPQNAAMARERAIGERVDGGLACRFAVVRGSYAISVLHDEDGDQELDTGFMGIPREGWGASNNARPAFRAPTFDEARVDVSSDLVTRVTLNY